MNKQEQFDKWVRHEVESLDNAPLDFDESAIWQKMQAELHSVSLVMPTKEASESFWSFRRKKRFVISKHFVTPTKTGSMRASISAAAVLLMVLAGFWWQWSEVPLVQDKITAVETTNVKPTPPSRGIPPRRELAQQLVPNEKPLLSGSPKRELTRSISPLPHLTTTEIPTSEIADLPIVAAENHLAEIKIEKTVNQTDDASLVLRSTQLTVSAKALSIVHDSILPEKKTKPKFRLVPQTDDASLTLGLIQLTVSAEALSIVPKKKPKPKFKIVHANELVDYQRAELAEVREKEAQRNSFVVINWKQKGQESENNLMTYLRNRNNKAE